MHDFCFIYQTVNNLIHVFPLLWFSPPSCVGVSKQLGGMSCQLGLNHCTRERSSYCKATQCYNILKLESFVWLAAWVVNHCFFWLLVKQNLIWPGHCRDETWLVMLYTFTSDDFINPRWNNLALFQTRQSMHVLCNESQPCWRPCITLSERIWFHESTYTVDFELFVTLAH